MSHIALSAVRRRSRLAAVALAAAATSASGLTALAAPASAATSDVVEQTVTIQEHQNGYALATVDGEGSRIVARDYRDASTSFWVSNKPGGRVDFVRNVNGTERVVEMDTRDSRTTQFIHWWAGANQQWTLENAAEGGTYIHNASDGRCLTFNGLDREVTVENCNGSTAQRFDLVGSGGGQNNGSSVEQRFLQRVNDLRAQYGRPALRYDQTLAQGAQCNADQMNQRRVSGHFCDSASILKGLGYNWRAWGEIAFYGPTDVDAAVDGWINSSGHRDIMLKPDVTEVGLARTGNASWNADFGAR
ncbi:CAP domain-containing protein [Streptomyces sp. SP17BM10]|uniref:CAP domain-containing protein n=1 Tax=Streptomyces sp. SP17BM10 TaxID=3002530 RepID=UPI002E76011B|nr:CAP domain-containing protein [Streptomyces sp. SP17BM10]MEE1788207.1 CAP domain-containing protein [Streptomyces sp. SP17BM10]